MVRIQRDGEEEGGGGGEWAVGSPVPQVSGCCYKLTMTSVWSEGKREKRAKWGGGLILL